MSQDNSADYLYQTGSDIDDTPVMPSIESIYDWEEDPLDLVSSPMFETDEGDLLTVPDSVPYATYYSRSASVETSGAYYTTPSPENFKEGSYFSTPSTWTEEPVQDSYFSSCFNTPSSWINASSPSTYTTPPKEDISIPQQTMYVYLVGGTANTDSYCPIAAATAVAKLPWGPQEKRRSRRRATAKTPVTGTDLYCPVAAASAVVKLPWGPQESKRAKRIAVLKIKIQAKPMSAPKTKATPKAKAKPDFAPRGSGRVRKSKPKPKKAKAKSAKGPSTQLKLEALQNAFSSLITPDPRFAIPQPRPGELHMSAATDFDEEEWYEKLKALEFVV